MGSTAVSPNHVEGLTARSSATGKNEYLLSNSGALQVSVINSGSSTTTFVTNGQVVPNTIATPLGSVTGLSNGVIISALSANTGKVYVGGAGVTVANGFELVAGQATSIAAATLGQVYVIATNGTDGVSFLGN